MIYFDVNASVSAGYDSMFLFSKQRILKIGISANALMFR